MNTSKNMLVAAIVSSGLIFSSAGHANEYVREVDYQLAAVASGQYVTYQHIGRLQRGRAHTLNIYLHGGVPYTIYGRCDRDCVDMDLELRDENNNPIDWDLDMDAIPVVVNTPSWSGPFTLKVTIPDCRANWCTYGVVAVAQ
ncbi:MAG TPA: hypothetical protein PL143_05540 [Rhodocyclaceae bacterium]|nr:hypothetical protein [Rhodocyclaceae bacterium]